MIGPASALYEIMLIYIIKRILLMIPTLFGIMLITFMVTQFVPGGPVEKMVAEIEGQGQAGAEAASSTSAYRGDMGLDQERLDALKKLYGFDQPPLKRFLKMMGNYLFQYMLILSEQEIHT